MSAVTHVSQADLSRYYQQPWETYWLDKLNSRVEPIDPLYRRLMTTVLGFVESPRVVLDVACGVGIHAILLTGTNCAFGLKRKSATYTRAKYINLARYYPEAEIFAMDLSFPQLPIARQLAESQDLDHRLHWLCGDVQALPLNIQPDHVLCTEVLEHLQEPATALEQVRRLCTSCTWLIVSVPQVYGSAGMSGVFYKQVLPNTGETIETQDPTRLRAGLPVYRYYHAQYTAAQLRTLLQSAGFRIEVIQPVIFKIPLRLAWPNENVGTGIARRGRNGLARVLHYLLLNQPSDLLDRWLCRLRGGVWAANLVALCKAG